MQATRQLFLQWRYGGTVDISYHLANIERGVQQTSALAAKVQKGMVKGDPHVTPRQGQPIDRLHISGVLGRGNLKRSQKETSFHYYPDTGELITKKYGTIDCNGATAPGIGQQGEPSSAVNQATESNNAASESGWEWDSIHQMYRLYDAAIGNWIYHDRSTGKLKYWLDDQWVERT